MTSSDENEETRMSIGDVISLYEGTSVRRVECPIGKGKDRQ
jgi:hypothetical protein